MRIAIIDDEKEFGLILHKEVLKFYPSAQIDIFSTVSSDLFHSQYDIIFLDVMLGLEKSFEYGERILDLYPDVILVYISSLNDFVYDSYKQKSFFFVRKEKLNDDLKAFHEKYTQYMLCHLATISIRYANQQIELLQREIIYIESHRNQIIIHTEFTEYPVYMTLKKILELLDMTTFYKLNSSIIINFNQIIDVEKEKIIMKKHIPIYFTRNSQVSFMNAYLSYRRRKLWNG